MKANTRIIVDIKELGINSTEAADLMTHIGEWLKITKKNGVIENFKIRVIYPELFPTMKFPYDWEL